MNYSLYRLRKSTKAYTTAFMPHNLRACSLSKASQLLQYASKMELEPLKDTDPVPLKFSVHIPAPKDNEAETIGPESPKISDALTEALTKWHAKHGDITPPRPRVYVGENCISPRDAGAIMREETGKTETTYPDSIFAWDDQELEAADVVNMANEVIDERMRTLHEAEMAELAA